MKIIQITFLGMCLLTTAAAHAQTNAAPQIPLQDSSQTSQGKQGGQDKKLSTSPMPMPKTGSPSDDTLIRNQRGASTSPDSSKYRSKDMKRGKRRGGSGAMDTTGTRRKNN